MSTVVYWHVHRDETGYPNPCDREPSGKLWWWQTEIMAFHRKHEVAKSAALSEVDRSGDADELVTAAEARRILGYQSRGSSLPAALLDNPDDLEELPSGRARRRWRRATVWAVADNRVTSPGAGRPAGTRTGPRGPHTHTPMTTEYKRRSR